MSLQRVVSMCALLVVSAFAADVLHSQPILSSGPYDPAVPVPRSVLGYEIGDRFTDYRLLERYVEAVAAASPRVKLITYGTTAERRPLRVAIITSPEHQARLDEIRKDNLRLTDPRSITTGDAEAIVAREPAIIWLSYGVHGNEASSPEAAMAVLYQLAAGNDDITRSILDRAVTIVDPCVNPDGRERYVTWYNGRAQDPPSTNAEAAEHAEPWPGGRTNHYFFDLNRDWAWLTQAESQARVTLYKQWMPHTHVDFHEMGQNSTYFFFPAAVPFHEVLPPEVARWGEIYGKANAAAFDSVGGRYYIGERFDMFYPGYGDSWPTFNGAIGMTYEQAGSSRAGLAVRRTDGDTLTLRLRARNHFLTSITTLRATVERRRDRIADFASYFRTALDAPKGRTAFMFRSLPDPGLANRAVRQLMAEGVDVRRLSESATLPANRYFAPRTDRIRFEAGTYVVPLSQPQRRLATALLEPRAAARDTFFYDISAWSLPAAFGLDAYETTAQIPASAERLTSPPPEEGSLIAPANVYAYLIPPERFSSVKLAVWLLGRGHALHVSDRPFQSGGRYYRAGTLVLFVRGDGATLKADLERGAAEFGVDIVGVSTGLTEAGISLGSDHVRLFNLPSVRVVTDDPVSSSDYGEVWHLFERELRIPFTAARARDLGGSDLAGCDVLILPDGGRWKSVLDSGATARLRSWLDGGGVLIALDGSARAIGKAGLGIVPAILWSDRKDDEKEKAEKDQEKARKAERKEQTQFGREEQERLERIPGTMFRAIVDSTNAVGYGLPSTVTVFKGDGVPIQLSDQALSPVRFANDTTALSGYLPAVKGRSIANSAYVQEFRVGRGSCILFSDDPVFRGFWWTTTRMLVNAVLFKPPLRMP